MESLTGELRRHRVDLALGAALAICAGAASLAAQARINPHLYEFATWDVWFDADIPRVVANMVSTESNHNRAKVHPLFSLTGFSLVTLFRQVFDGLSALRATVALAAAAFVAAMFGCLRALGCRRLDTLLLLSIAVSSAAWWFWSCIPETFLFGAVTIAIGLWFVAVAERRRFGPLPFAAAGALTLSMTVTNGMLGAAAALAHHPRRRAIAICAAAFGILVAVWVVQRFIIPSAQFPLRTSEEQHYLFLSMNGGPLAIAKTFLVTTVVAPEIAMDQRGESPFLYFRMQLSPLGSGSVWGGVASALWLAVLGMAIWTMAARRPLGRTSFVVAACLAGQLALHLVYGGETFLFSMHFLPFFIAALALGTLGPLRRPILLCALPLVVLAGMNNHAQWKRATEAGWGFGPSPRVEPRGITPEDTGRPPGHG